MPRREQQVYTELARLFRLWTRGSAPLPPGMSAAGSLPSRLHGRIRGVPRRKWPVPKKQLTQIGTVYMPHAIVVLVLILIGAGDAHAFNFSFPFFPGSSDREGPPMGSPPWQFRPQDPSNARGAPPGYTTNSPPQEQTEGYQAGQGYPSGPGYQAGGPGYRSGPGYPLRPGGYPPGPGYRPVPGYQGYQPGPGYRPGGGYQPAWPGQYGGGYQQQQAQQANRAPRVEVEVEDHQPYVQENVLLKLRVVSDVNLDTANPELPNSNDFLLQHLEGPTARSREDNDGQREIVNEFVYTLTPLRAGDLEIPRLKVTGSFSARDYYGRSNRFEATTTDPVHLQVRPAMMSVQPWLPLRNLELKATLDGNGDVEEGQPVTLALELDATGATGSQLPSLESWLGSKDFRVYREQTLTEGKLSADGRRLVGKRTEYYTLVPHSGGKLRLPEIRLPWWNITTGSREYATLPIRTLQVDGDSGPFGLPSSTAALAGGGMSRFWLPLLGVGLLLLGYWGGVWYRGYKGKHPDRKALGDRLGLGLRAAASGAAAGLGTFVNRLDPAPALRRMKPQLSRALPPSSRFLMCVRAANREHDPVAWCERFQAMTCHHLRFDAKTPLPGVAGRILALRPSADPEHVRRLMQQLDAALYGHQDIDFGRWKKQFLRQVGRGRGLLRVGARRPYWQRPSLPDLNPQP